MKRIEDYIISVPDFPQPGILFRDITGILNDADGLKLTLDALYKALENVEFDLVAGLEARGFLFGVSIAEHFHKPFVPVRKKGKLPRETVGISYDLEYGQASIEVHKDAIKPGQKVVIIDDLLATGGTARAAAHKRMLALMLKISVSRMGNCSIIHSGAAHTPTVTPAISPRHTSSRASHLMASARRPARRPGGIPPA